MTSLQDPARGGVLFGRQLAARGGALLLGTWQRVVVIDPNVDNPERTLLLDFVPSP